MKPNQILTAADSTEISTAMRQKSTLGYVIGTARLGYKPSRTHSSASVVAIPDPEMFPLLRDAFVMATRGSSVRQVTAWLVKQGVKGKRGGQVSVATVQRMLTDPFYAGFIKDQAGCFTNGRHQALVTKQTFALVQRKLLEKRCCPLKTNETPQPNK